MRIKINKIKVNFAGDFEVIVNDKPSYTGSTSWFSSMLSNKLFDLNGNIVLESHFLPLEELKNLVPFKWAWSEKQTENHAVFNKAGQAVALFMRVRRDFIISEKYVVKYGDYDLSLYPIDKWRNQFTLIFLNDIQIGQINKDRLVEDTKDWYRLYLLDEYADLAPVLSLFTIYYDRYKYSNPGQVVAYKSEIRYQWTYSKFKKLYDPGWLPAHFTLVDDKQMTAEMTKRFKERIKLILGVFLGLWVLFGIIFAILWFTDVCPR